MNDRIERVRQALAMRDADYNVRPRIEDIGNLLHQYDRLRVDNEKLRERLGPYGLEVIEIDGAGHYVNEKVKAEINRLRAELAVMTSYRDRLVVISNSVIEERDCLRAEFANTEGLLADARTEISHYMLSLSEVRAELAEAKARIDTLESAQIDYEVQCDAKDARIKEEFDKYCRNLTELAQVHKESCDAKDARIAELEEALHITLDEREEAIARVAELETDHLFAENKCLREACQEFRARAERAEARIAELEKSQPTFDECMAYVARADRAESELVDVQVFNHELDDKLKAAESERALHIEAYNAMLARSERAEARVAELEAALNAMWPMTEAEASLKSHALKGTFDDFPCSKEHITVQPPCVEPRPAQMSDQTMLMECLGLLHRFGLEQTGWRGVLRRWYYSDEPLRHDAANLVRRAEYMTKRPEFTRLVGGEK